MDAGMVSRNMTVTRHISLDDDHIEKMKPYLEKHNGNFGAALREIINLAGKYSPRMNSSAIDISLFNWTLSEIDGTLVPGDVLDETINPALINSMGRLEEYLKRRFSELEWDIDPVLKYDSDTFPSDVLLEIKGAPQKIKFAARMVSQYLVKNSLEHAPLEIKNVMEFNECIKVELSRSNKKDAQSSLYNFFGGMDEVMKIVKNRPAFWKAVIQRHLLSNYNMVTVHRNYFEDMLADKIPLGEITIENLAKKPLHEIPLKEMLSLIKEVYETSRIAERVDVDNDTIALFHNFRTKEAIEKLKKSLVMLLEANGHLYDATLVANMIVLKHRPDVGTRINEIVDNLKTSNSTVDLELLLFMAFLKGIKDIPDIPLSLTALGRRFGASLMQEYESENGIKRWNLESFKKALEIIDSRLHRESEWKLEGNNLLYTIKRCSLVTEGNTFDTYICHTIRETFKGAVNYAFGGKAEFSVNKSIIQGDNFCEVTIRIP
jgi:predicted hydrocarbon binding protein